MDRKLLNLVVRSWKPDSVVVYCDDCDTVVYEMKSTDGLAKETPSYLAAEVEFYIEHHSYAFGHTSFSVDVDTEPVIEPIDCTVTVEGDDGT